MMNCRWAALSSHHLGPVLVVLAGPTPGDSSHGLLASRTPAPQEWKTSPLSLRCMWGSVLFEWFSHRVFS
ncbi:hypothetical protein DPEC_G00225740 [Dallia pectoralis]|uniref:Uncharacterized protein n=1 Tax=Dallia pectoralis TaxID=75939 RepID=A0ACC2G0Q9_DALPE|nr:hypothetical protein DPEC_G00225740 [Dallia pectoralis]